VSRPDSQQSERPAPPAFEAYDDCAAYVDGRLSRAQAITEARDVHWPLRDDYLRRELRAIRVYMAPVAGEEAEEFFGGEFDTGWIEVPDRLIVNDAQRSKLIRMWRVEPAPPKTGEQR
jgi:hypothetical protein